MNALLNRLMLRHKFALLGLMGLVLVAVPLGLYIQESDKSVSAAEAKVQGMAPTRAVLNAVLLMQQHRGLSAMVLAGDTEAQATRAAKQGEVDRALAAGDAMVRQVGNAAIAGLWQEATSRWAPLAGKVAQHSFAGPQSFAEHTALITQLLKVNEMLADHFGLTLDTQADSYHLVDAALAHAPIVMETLGRMRAGGAAMLTRQEGSLEERALMMAMIDKVGDRYALASNAIEKAIAANPALKDSLAGPLQAALAAGKQTLDLAQEQIVKQEQLSYSAPAYFAKVTDAIGAQVKLYDAAASGLEKVLNAHRSELTNTAYMLIGIVLLQAALTALVGLLISRSISKPLAEAVVVAQQVAAGDLSARIEIKSRDETGQLMQALKNMNDSLVSIVSEVRSGTDTIATASSQIAAGNLDLSSRTEQQASSLEETASSMEEITGTVKQNADNARQANQLASSASEVASRGGTMVSNVVKTMGSINESSKKIVDIISVIDGIAFQTNILALNAAVEAARAGEQGRGFAVVATEVRNLAQRSASAAKEIKTLISDSVEKVDAGAKLVDQTGATMEEIVASIRRVSDIIAEITAASDEQSSGIEQVNVAINQMDQVTQQNASLVEEAAAAAEALQDQAQKLAQAVSVFQLDGTHAHVAHLAVVRPMSIASIATKEVARLPSTQVKRLRA